MAKITLPTITSGYNLTKLNEALQLIQDELNNKVLYRDNPEGEDNSLQSDIDWNSKKILNLPLPTSQDEPARVQDIDTAVGESEAAADRAEAAADETEALLLSRGELRNTGDYQGGGFSYLVSDVFKASTEDWHLVLTAFTSTVEATDITSGNVQVWQGVTSLDTTLFDTLSGATSRTDLLEGASIRITDRADSIFDYVTGETANNINIIAHDTLPLQIKLREIEETTLKSLGAAGDGVTDDSLEVIQLGASDVSARATDRYITTLIDGDLSGQILTRKEGAQLNLTGSDFIAKTDDYTKGQAINTTARWSFFKSTVDNTFVSGLSFDGVDQYTNDTFQPSLVNIHFQPFVLYGTDAGTRIDRQWVSGISSLGSGGHSVQFGFSNNNFLTFSYMRRHAGSGFLGFTENSVAIGNVYEEGLDSHLIANNADNTAMVGNVANGNINGGVVDVAGSRTTNFTGNVGVDGTNTGVWVIRSPNSDTPSENTHIGSNLLKNTTQAPESIQGEVTVGSRDAVPAEQVDTIDTSIIGNQLHTINNLSTLRDNSAIAAGYGSYNTCILSNYLAGVKETLKPTIDLRGTTDTIYAGNAANLTDNASGNETFATVELTDGNTNMHYANNVKTRISSDSDEVPVAMESMDALNTYHIVRSIPANVDYTTFELTTEGGNSTHIYDLEFVSADSSEQVYSRKIVLFGNSSATTQILASVDQLGGLTHTGLTVSLDRATKVGSTLVVLHHTNAGATDFACVCRCVSPQDDYRRIVPIMST